MCHCAKKCDQKHYIISTTVPHPYLIPSVNATRSFITIINIIITIIIIKKYNTRNQKVYQVPFVMIIYEYQDCYLFPPKCVQCCMYGLCILFVCQTYEIELFL